MVKKSKKKTIASTRKHELTPEELALLEQQKKSNKGIKKLINKTKAGVKKTKSAVQKVVVKKQEKQPKAEEKKSTASAVSDELNAMSAEMETTSITKETKKKARKEKIEKLKSKIRIKPEHKQKIKGGILALIGLFAVTYIGLFLFGKFFRPQPFAEMLPKSETVAVFELNVDAASDQVKNYFETFKNYPVYQKAGLEGVVNVALNLNYENDIESWIGRKIGFALLNFQPENVKAEEKSVWSPVVFLESRNHELTLEKIKNRALQESKLDLIYSEYQGNKLYSYTSAGRFHFMFLNNYLVITSSDDVLKFMLDKYSAGNKLAEDESYIKVVNNLPTNNLGFAYINYGGLFESLLQNDPKFVAEKGQDYNALKPFLSLFKSSGYVLISEKGKVVAQEYTLVDKDKLGDQEFLSFSEKYQGTLLEYPNQDLVLVAGGHDIVKELRRLQELFKAGTKTSALIFDGLLEAQKEQYFGKDISLKDDIYPLLDGEYLLTVEKSFEEPIITLYLELKDKNEDSAKLEKLASAFVQTSGIFTPKIQEVVLPDGTKGKEIVASPETIQRFDESIEGINTTSLQVGSTGTTLYYALVGSNFVMSTSKENIKNVILRDNGKLNDGMSTSRFFQNDIKPLLSNSDEMFMMKVGALSALTGLTQNEAVKPYILPFGNLTVTKNYFADGISSIYQFEIL